MNLSAEEGTFDPVTPPNNSAEETAECRRLSGTLTHSLGSARFCLREWGLVASQPTMISDGTGQQAGEEMNDWREREPMKWAGCGGLAGGVRREETIQARRAGGGEGERPLPPQG